MSKSLEERVLELEKKVQELTESKTVKIENGLGIGDTFKLAGLTWKILNITEKGYSCLAEKLEERMTFDSDCNNWQSSDLRNYLNTDFFKKLVEVVGEDNIVSFERDLFSLDGQTEYGICEDKISLLTVDEYRKYRKLIPNTDDDWWWLITPWSTPCNNWESNVALVSPSGNVYDGSCNRNRGVRPVCIFSSAIFESEE